LNCNAKVMFMGSAESTLDKIAEKARVEFPNIDFVGFYSPPFKTEFDNDDNERMLEAIRLAGPDVLWVGLTAPKQEKWLYENRSKINVPFCGAIGAVFDFYSGTVRRPPRVVQKMGLEWLLRLIQEPRRLWRRTIFSTPIFLRD